MRLYVMGRRKAALFLLVAMALASAAASMLARTVGGPPVALDRLLITRLNMIFSDRAQAVVQGNPEPLVSHYDLESTYGRWALDREERRIRYVQAWSKARRVRFIDSAVEIRVDSADLKGDFARLRLRQSADFAYLYDADPAARPDHFGIGTRHLVELVRKGETWVIRRDWYTDPLDEDSIIADVRPALVPEGAFPTIIDRKYPQEDTRLPTDTKASPGMPSNPLQASRYDRGNAVAYANEYCGLAWGCGNNREYNSKYKDFTGLGGDCTNFVSQVLGDAAGGGLLMDWTWRYTYKGIGAGASRAWAQAGALAGYLIASGRAIRMARGTYADVVTPSERYPHGAIGALDLGDLIAYEEKGRLVHFAVVTGTDSHGYVVVNSHTADRYHVPWDIGWDRTTVFWLLKIVY
ncbi:MAG: amidase domain-containing protein [Bacillota bacterium]